MREGWDDVCSGILLEILTAGGDRRHLENFCWDDLLLRWTEAIIDEALDKEQMDLEAVFLFFLIYLTVTIVFKSNVINVNKSSESQICDAGCINQTFSR